MFIGGWNIENSRSYKITHPYQDDPHGVCSIFLQNRLEGKKIHANESDPRSNKYYKWSTVYSIETRNFNRHFHALRWFHTHNLCYMNLLLQDNISLVYIGFLLYLLHLQCTFKNYTLIWFLAPPLPLFFTNLLLNCINGYTKSLHNRTPLLDSKVLDLLLLVFTDIGFPRLPENPKGEKTAGDPARVCLFSIRHSLWLY